MAVFARIATIIVALLVVSSICRAVDLPTEPILRIETGVHTAEVMCVDATPDGSILTVSKDKTVRLWRITRGQLLHEYTYRVPIDTGREGQLYSCALSADGRWIAVGGHTTAGSRPKTATVYIIDRRTRRLVRSITNLENATHKLAFNADGSRLLIGLGSDAGVRVATIPQGTIVATDKQYGAPCTGLTWLPDGGFMSVSGDGYLRRYAASFQLTDKVPASHTPHPAGITLYRGEVVCGSADTPPSIGFYDQRSLQLRSTVKDPRLVNGNLRNVVAMGGKWWASGTLYDPEKHFLLLQYQLTDNGAELIKLPGALTNVTSLAAVGESAVVAGSADPLLKIYNANGDDLIALNSQACNFRGKQGDAFMVSPDGSQVRFQREMENTSPAMLDVLNGVLTTDSRPAPEHLLPQGQGVYPSATITGTPGTSQLTIGGRAQAYEGGEKWHAYAQDPTTRQVVVAGGQTLRGISYDGVEIWSLTTPGDCWSVNIAPETGLAIAVYADGTIRWHSLKNGGREILAAYVTRDGRRWVAWTPSGYYMAGPGGEDLIGWHVNRGPNQLADFYPASRFREKFYRPSIIRAVLKTQDEALALGQEATVDAASSIRDEQPPTVRIVSHVNGEEFDDVQTVLKFTIDTPEDAPVTQIIIRVNHATERGFGIEQDKSAQIYKRELTLPRADCVIEVFAVNRHNTSEVASLQLKWTGTDEPPAAADQTAPAKKIKPTCYILSIGVGAYQDTAVPSLQYAPKDARDFAAAMMQQEGGELYDQVMVNLIENATRIQVLEGLKWIANQGTARDIFIIYISGHGKSNERDKYYFLPSDVSYDKYEYTSIPSSQLVETVGELTGKIYVFLDTCHSGNDNNRFVQRGMADSTSIVNRLMSAPNGAIVFASAQGNEAALESSDWENGAFTKALCEAMTGDTTDLDKIVFTDDELGTADAKRKEVLKLKEILKRDVLTLSELEYYVLLRVKILTGGRQSPPPAAMRDPTNEALQGAPIRVLR